ncbi:MAG: SUMF1/EgtB/PvdO family nonheme iron enzyme [Myxococcales bacterium]|nr:SUMF1/EgtB/PvdO family nonheme iron enzyme [Myxococcales bacterium]
MSAPISKQAIQAWVPPPVFDDYRLIRPLGQGEMGAVYLAHDRVLDRAVAIKFIRTLEVRARDRFIVEARAAARIQHPNVMAIHRIGELDTHPYLVTEYVRGKSLADLALPLPWRQVLELSVGLARGLAAAHRHGVLHRDIKLANAIVGEDGGVKLLDFSLAKLVDNPLSGARERSGGFEGYGSGETRPEDSLTQGLVGTPNYMAPELWRAEPASRSSDVYALGVLLHVLCSGNPPTDVSGLGQLAQRVQMVEPTPLRERVAGVDPRFAAILDRCVRRRPSERYASGEELRLALEALSAAVNAGHAAATHAGNPYRGLRAFEAEHREVFFGRGTEIQTVIDRLRAQSLVVVAGDSGVGKSSLCRAGVLPLLQDGILDATSNWYVATITPGRHPLTSIIAALSRHLGTSSASISASIEDPHEELEREIRRAQAGRRGFVLLVDQLEELVTLAEPSEAAEAAALLVRLAAGHPGVRVVATVRGDFLTRLAQLPGLGAELPRSLCFLLPLSIDAVREAIVGPANAQQVHFESEELVERLVTAGVEGSLPLLQFALAELWEAREPDSSIITAAALERIGGVSGALARHADAALARLDAGPRRAARGLLLRLVTVDDTRASLTSDELVSCDEDQAALDALIAAHLLVVRDVPGGIVHEIAHEALIRGWVTLKIWLEEEREGRLLRHQLETAAAAWERDGRPGDLLWQPKQLAGAHLVDAGSLRLRELTFLSASRARARRRVLLRRLAIAAVPLVATAGLFGLYMTQRTGQDERIAAHRTAAADDLAAARTLAGDVAGLRAEAFAAFDAGDAARGEAAWERALAEAPAIAHHHDAAARELEAALGIDGERSDVREALADVLYERALLAEQAGQAAEAEALIERAALYDDDGDRLARWQAPAVLTVTSEPLGARVTVESYAEGEGGRLTRSSARDLGVTPLQELELPAGSYRFTFTADGLARAYVPVLVRRGERPTVSPALLPASRVPAGFVHVPGGRFLYGTGAAESLRKGSLAAAPLHEVTVPAFLVARHETTYGEWIAFLEDLAPEQRARYLADPASARVPTLVDRGPGAWELHVPRGEATIVTRSGEPFVYPGRATRASHDWSRMPVGGLTPADAEAYVEWLDRSGRVPGARLCNEFEWEYAARGADGRSYPGGARLDPEDANFAGPHARDVASRGPDEVGSHPASDSPFDLRDAAGNLFEWVAAGRGGDERLVRGGAYVSDMLGSSLEFRGAVDALAHAGAIGLRVCATPR